MSRRSDAWLVREEIRLRLRVWAPARPRGGVAVVHGLGDHGLRYESLALALAEVGLVVHAPDLRGHGESPGRRGDARVEDLLGDLAASVSALRRDLPSGAPIGLVGHSMGGLLVLGYLQGRGTGRPGLPRGRALTPPRGVVGGVLSAPWVALAHPLPRWKRVLGELLLRVAPGVPLASGVTPSALTRDPEMRRRYEMDPLVHARCSPRLFRGIEEAQREAWDDAPGLQVPLLVLLPGNDPIVDPEETLRLIARFPAGRVTAERLPGGLHEPFHDLDRDRVVETVVSWMAARVRSWEWSPEGRGPGGVDGGRGPGASSGRPGAETEGSVNIRRQEGTGR